MEISENNNGKINFPTLYRKWIMECVTTASIMVNGYPTNEFKFERGLWQCDLLSPFLFLLVAQGIYFMKAIMEVGLFIGYSALGKSSFFRCDNNFSLATEACMCVFASSFLFWIRVPMILMRAFFPRVMFSDILPDETFFKVPCCTLSHSLPLKGA